MTELVTSREASSCLIKIAKARTQDVRGEVSSSL